MERITIVIHQSGTAFEDGPATETARILREMADRMEYHGLLPVPRDVNGNKCGSVTVAPIED